jgi:hypothetical protein
MAPKILAARTLRRALLASPGAVPVAPAVVNIPTSAPVFIAIATPDASPVPIAVPVIPVATVVIAPVTTPVAATTVVTAVAPWEQEQVQEVQVQEQDQNQEQVQVQEQEQEQEQEFTFQAFQRSTQHFAVLESLSTAVPTPTKFFESALFEVTEVSAAVPISPPKSAPSFDVGADHQEIMEAAMQPSSPAVAREMQREIEREVQREIALSPASPSSAVATEDVVAMQASPIPTASTAITIATTFAVTPEIVDDSVAVSMAVALEEVYDDNTIMVEDEDDLYSEHGEEERQTSPPPTPTCLSFSSGKDGLVESPRSEAGIQEEAQEAQGDQQLAQLDEVMDALGEVDSPLLIMPPCGDIMLVEVDQGEEVGEDGDEGVEGEEVEMREEAEMIEGAEEAEEEKTSLAQTCENVKLLCDPEVSKMLVVLTLTNNMLTNNMLNMSFKTPYETPAKPQSCNSLHNPAHPADPASV